MDKSSIPTHQKSHQNIARRLHPHKYEKLSNENSKSTSKSRIDPKENESGNVQECYLPTHYMKNNNNEFNVSPIMKNKTIRNSKISQNEGNQRNNYSMNSEGGATNLEQQSCSPSLKPFGFILKSNSLTKQQSESFEADFDRKKEKLFRRSSVSTNASFTSHDSEDTDFTIKDIKSSLSKILRSPSRDKDKQHGKSLLSNNNNKNIEMRCLSPVFHSIDKQRKQQHRHYNDPKQIDQQQHAELMAKINDLQCELRFEKEKNRVLQQKLVQEIGDGVTINKVFATGWRGRAHEVALLKSKLNELQLLIQKITNGNKDSNIKDNRNKEVIATSSPFRITSPSSINSNISGSNSLKKKYDHTIDASKELDMLVAQKQQISADAIRNYKAKDMEIVKSAYYKIRNEKEMLNRKLWKAKVRIACLEKELISVKDSFAII